MKILGHIHTFNDADIIDRTVQALLDQTHPLARVIIVDNASSDGTVDREFPDKVEVRKHERNLGTSGAIVTGMRYGLEQGFDWIWILDADSVVEADALARLLELYEEMDAARRDEVGFLACLPLTEPDTRPMHGGLFTAGGIALARPQPGARRYECHFTIWSGCLYPLAAVRAVGPPAAHYVLDWGEFEYGYRLMKAGYKGFIDQRSILHHNVRGRPSLSPGDVHLGPLTVSGYEFPAIRCYYMARNMLYFSLYEIHEHRLATLRGVLWRVVRLAANFLLRPVNHGPQIAACLRGIWHGLTGNIEGRY